jgi:hypothetical protein
MKLITIVSLIFLFLITCQGQQKQYKSDIIHIHGLEFTEELKITQNKKSGDTLRIEGVLKNTTVINGIPCSGEITFTGDWQLSEFILGDEFSMGEYSFPAGTKVGVGIDIHTLKMHYFALRGSKNYVVNMCKFDADQEIKGIVCDSEYPVFFKTDWTFLGCILAQDDTIAGNIFPKETYVRFNNDSTIRCFCLSEPIVQGYQCSSTDYTRRMWMGGGGIVLYPSGKLKYFQPSDEVEIMGVYCKHSSARGGVTLYENGKLKSCTSAIDQTIDGVFCGKRHNLEFDEEGKLTYAEKEKIFD